MKIYFIAGEVSGDLQASLLIKELKKIYPGSDLDMRGIGGPLMAAEGMKISHDLTKESVLGLTDVLMKYFHFRKIFHQALREVKEFQPDAIVLVDYPGFNLRFANQIKKQFPVIYYISPQLWAWANHRIHKIKENVNRMIVLFSFEAEMYEKAGVPVTWIGHPLIEKVKPTKSREALREEWFPGEPNTKVVTFFSGSRHTEVQRILPEMLKTAQILYKDHKDLKFLLSESSNIDASIYNEIVQQFGAGLPITRLRNRGYDLLFAADFALITSGTATLETAISETPFVLLYKTAELTFFLGRLLVQIPFIGLMNIVAGRKIVPEFIQHEIKPDAIAKEAELLIYQNDLRQKMISELKEIKKKLGEPGAAHRAAEAVAKVLTK